MSSSLSAVVRSRRARLHAVPGRGSTSILFAMVAAVVLMSVMALLGFSARISAVQRAGTAADEAGRAAAQQVDSVLAGGGGGPVRLDSARAADAARAYLARVGATGTVTVSGTEIQISTQLPWSGAGFSGVARGEASVNLRSTREGTR